MLQWMHGKDCPSGKGLENPDFLAEEVRHDGLQLTSSPWLPRSKRVPGPTTGGGMIGVSHPLNPYSRRAADRRASLETRLQSPSPHPCPCRDVRDTPRPTPGQPFPRTAGNVAATGVPTGQPPHTTTYPSANMPCMSTLTAAWEQRRAHVRSPRLMPRVFTATERQPSTAAGAFDPLRRVPRKTQPHCQL